MRNALDGAGELDDGRLEDERREDALAEPSPELRRNVDPRRSRRRATRSTVRSPSIQSHTIVPSAREHKEHFRDARVGGRQAFQVKEERACAFPGADGLDDVLLLEVKTPRDVRELGGMGPRIDFTPQSGSSANAS